MAVSEVDLQFDSATGQNRIKPLLYLPANGDSIRAVLIIIHGMAEHQMRYAPFAQYLSSRGWAVCSFDLPGHGQTAPDPDQLGYFAEADAGRMVLADVEKLVFLVQDRFADKKIFILGHSMGSLIARQFCVQTSLHLAGAIFSGDVAPNPMAGPAVFLAKRSAKMNGSHHRDQKLDRLMHRGFLKKIPDARCEFDWISKDHTVVDAYMDDPYCGFVFTANGFITLFQWVRAMSRRNWAIGMHSEMPVLFVYGDHDPVGGYGKGVEKNIRHLTHNGNPVTSRKYERGRHEMLNELERIQVWQDIETWMTKQTATKDD